MSGVVEKKSFASYAFSYFVLFEGFKMMEVVSYNMKEPKNISISPISAEIAVEKIDDTRFRMIADECNWKVRAPNANEWADAINSEYSKTKA